MELNVYIITLLNFDFSETVELILRKLYRKQVHVLNYLY